jgi:hypothetical protein
MRTVARDHPSARVDPVDQSLDQVRRIGNIVVGGRDEGAGEGFERREQLLE